MTLGDSDERPDGDLRRQTLPPGGPAATALLMAGARRAPALVSRPDVAGAPPPEQMHVQFGADAATQIAVSWAAPAPAARPGCGSGCAGDGYGPEVLAEERVYTEALTGEIVHHLPRAAGPACPPTPRSATRSSTTAPARWPGRSGPARAGARPGSGSPASATIPSRPRSGAGSALTRRTPATSSMPWTRSIPLFHLMNGDLCYANLSDAPVADLDLVLHQHHALGAAPAVDARAGNHENEVGQRTAGPCLAYQTRFELPGNGSVAVPAATGTRSPSGRSGSISLNNDDVCLQDGGFSAYRRDHVPGYRAADDLTRTSSGLQPRPPARLAGDANSPPPGSRRDRLDRGVHAPGGHVLGPLQRR